MLDKTNNNSPENNNNDNENDKSDATVNEIMVKVEMKRLNNLIANRDPLRNTLLKADKARVYPLNKQCETTGRVDLQEPFYKKNWELGKSLIDSKEEEQKVRSPRIFQIGPQGQNQLDAQMMLSQLGNPH